LPFLFHCAILAPSEQQVLLIQLYISELLYVSDCVIIPGLGGFVANSRSAFLNPAQHTFSPPVRRIAFNASLRTNDGLLANYVSRREGITYGDAVTKIKYFVEDVINRLQLDEVVQFEKIGSLNFDGESRIQFEPDTTENYSLDAFGLTPIHSPAIRREEGAKVKPIKVKGEKKSWQAWRLLELIPAAAVFALLVFNPNVIQKLNTGLAQILPLHEIYRAPEVKYSGVEDPNAAPFKIAPVVKESVLPAPVDSIPTTTPVQETELTPVDSTLVAPVVKEVETVVESHDRSARSFYVVGGCFRSEENAKNLVAEADLLGYDASIIGQNDQGLYVVSLFSSNKMSDVQAELSTIKMEFEKNAWVLVK
jgi:nucleoid DNA-binding protein